MIRCFDIIYLCIIVIIDFDCYKFVFMNWNYYVIEKLLISKVKDVIIIIIIIFELVLM